MRMEARIRGAVSLTWNGQITNHKSRGVQLGQKDGAKSVGTETNGCILLRMGLAVSACSMLLGRNLPAWTSRLGVQPLCRPAAAAASTAAAAAPPAIKRQGRSCPPAVRPLLLAGQRQWRPAAPPCWLAAWWQCRPVWSRRAE